MTKLLEFLASRLVAGPLDRALAELALFEAREIADILADHAARVRDVHRHWDQDDVADELTRISAEICKAYETAFGEVTA